MKISRELFQFPERSLIVVTDSQRARLFFAFEGLLSEQESIRIDPHREGSRAKLFLMRSKGKVVRSGAPEKKEVKDHVLSHLLKELEKRMTAAEKKHRVTAYYLLAPGRLLNQVSQSLHPDIQQQTRLQLPVDVIGAHPREIVERISKERLPE